jgi:ferric-dicitrate binding protein FerR (iron transport regulator)
MSSTGTPWDLGELIVLALDGSISPQQHAVLNERLRTDAEARQYYREFLTTAIALRMVPWQETGSFSGDEVAGRLDHRLWKALAEEESQAPGVPVGRAASPAPEAERQPRTRVLPRPSKWPLYTALAAAAVLVFLLGYIYFAILSVPARSAARLIAASGAKWAADMVARVGSPLPDRPLRLLEGSATIEVRRGAIVTMQGATQMSVKSDNEVYLASGTILSSITARDGLGFVVRTASAIVRDYGTEFIVTVSPDGRTQVVVTQGKVELTPLVGQADAQSGRVLSAGESGQVYPQGDVVTSASGESDPLASFVVRDRPDVSADKPAAGVTQPARFLDLADMLGGGNGLGGGRKPVSIDLVDGAVRDGLLPFVETISAGGYVVSPAPFVDGVFVPGGGPGPCTVSSAGHVFRDCPITSAAFAGGICNDSQAVLPDGAALKLHHKGRSWSPAPSIWMHSNSGITFDLDEVRRAHPLSEITMFSCRCGIAFHGAQSPAPAWADVFILVDGRKRFEKSASSADDRAEDVRIRLSPRDRFLTLVVADGSDGKLTNDDFLFVRPALHVRVKHQE